MKQYQDNYSIDYSQRDPAQGVDTLLYSRWSPRSYQKTDIPLDTLRAIFDAARWTQSCFNDQPWMFLTSSGEQDFEKFLGFLTSKNQQWAQNTSLIGFILARKHFVHNGKPNTWAQFDSGAAWMALTMQARMLGLYTHGMAGIKTPDIYTEFHIPEETYDVLCGFTIGVLDRPEKLPEDMATREKPSPRKPLDELWKRGAF
jgi:nitroreductase